MFDFQSYLGSMAWPLVLCALIAAVIILERIYVVLRAFWGFFSAYKKLLNYLSNHTTHTSKDEDFMRSVHDNSLIKETVENMLSYKNDKGVREEVCAVWLQKKTQSLKYGLKILNLIAVISPLLGLLGTVLGLMEMFANVAVSDGVVTPNTIANGLGIAMHTTAVGLIIAVPALVALHILKAWIKSIMDTLEQIANKINLWLDGAMVDSLLRRGSNTRS